MGKWMDRASAQHNSLVGVVNQQIRTNGLLDEILAELKKANATPAPAPNPLGWATPEEWAAHDAAASGPR